MKKVLFAAIAISIAFASCKKESDEVKPAKIEKKVLDGEEDGGDKKTGGNGWD
ncbi:hypothetical protein [Desertivirga xinjiangensis]|uniref:hypothetical protein n=1 Tax=Desertivirga xinjiangensis TaxID=539206 RepID=UPI00210DA255|nr:hypothetical protein [Pedobacter xinjiangensis]